MDELTIGVLGLQGAIEDHERALTTAAEEINIRIKIVRLNLPEDLNDVDGVVMPGGESTVMGLMGNKDGLINELLKLIKNDLPVFGTCAGAILLSKNIRKTLKHDFREGPFPLLDIEIVRNGYGRQRESFSTTLNVSKVGKVHGIFIRAPLIRKVGDEVEILGEIEGDPVFVKQKNIFATTFHPELSNNTSIHKLFLHQVLKVIKHKDINK